MKRRLAVAALSLSAAGLVSIANLEGFSEKAYIPIPGDVPTIGFGSTDGVRMGDTITPQKALERLMRDVGVAESAIGRCVKVPLSQSEYDAFTSFAFNVGGKAFCESTLVKKLNAGDYDGACDELERWVYSQKKVVPGLVNRRQVEHRLCTGNY